MRVSGIPLKPRSTCQSCMRKCCLRLAVGNLACPQRELDQFAARQITTKETRRCTKEILARDLRETSCSLVVHLIYPMKHEACRYSRNARLSRRRLNNCAVGSCPYPR